MFSDGDVGDNPLVAGYQDDVEPEELKIDSFQSPIIEESPVPCSLVSMGIYLFIMSITRGVRGCSGNKSPTSICALLVQIHPWKSFIYQIGLI